MKKVLFILLLLTSFIKVEATHLLGGELYFDKIDNQGRYLLTTILYRENSGLGVGLQLPVKTNATVSGTLMLPLVDSLPVATISLGCIGFGADAYVFQDTIQVLMPIPVSGYYFSHSTCCRPISLDNINHSGGSNSFAINARMYPGVERSPRFQSFPVLSGIAGASSFLNHSAFDPDIGDSIYIDLAAPNTNVQNGAFTSVSYKSNYSASFPFGTNVPTTIDNKTGLITVTNAPVGWYVVGVRVRSYTNGALTAETLRDVPIVFDNAVSPPNFTLSNIYGQASYAQNGANYDFEMNETDTLGFDLIASSTLLINNLPVDVGIEGFGDLLDTNFSGAGNCVGNSCMNFSSASGSFINPLLTSTNIFFRPDTGFVPSGLSHVYKYLSFDGFLLDTCNIPRRTSIGVRIKVNANGPIHSKAYYNSCKGIGVQANIQGDTTNLLWTPSHGVSNPNSATAWLDPDSSIVYSVKDLNTGFVIMVSVSVDSIGQSSVTLGNNGLELYVPQVVQNQEVSWYYNGALLPIGSDSTLPMVTGYYWAKVSHGVCSIWSDTVYVKITGKTSNTDYNGEGLNTQATKSTFSFVSSGQDQILEDLEIIFPDSTAGKTTSTISVVLIEQGQFAAMANATNVDQYVWRASGLDHVIKAGVPYKIEITTDLLQTVLFKPDLIPFSEPDGLVSITAGEYKENGTTVSGVLPYVNFLFNASIGIGENQLKTRVYPNPVKEIIKIEVDGHASIELSDLSGRIVLSSEIYNIGQLDVSDLPNGLYLYRIYNSKGTAKGKFIKE